MAKTKTASAFMPVTLVTATLCIRSGVGIAASPTGFHGKPVNRKLRSHSARPKPKASAAMRPMSLPQRMRAAAVAKP